MSRNVIALFCGAAKLTRVMDRGNEGDRPEDNILTGRMHPVLVDVDVEAVPCAVRPVCLLSP